MRDIFLKLQQSIKFLSNFSTEEIELIIKSAPRKSYNKSEFIYRHGSVGNELYIILSGEVKVSEISDGIPFENKILKYGEIFGISGFVLNKQRSEDVVSRVDKTSVVIISEYHINRNLSLAFRLFRALAIELSLQTRLRSNKITSYKNSGSKSLQHLKKLMEIGLSRNPQFTNLILSKNEFNNHTFTNTNFVNASFNESELNEVVFNRCDMSDSDFSTSINDNCQVKSCDFKKANFTAAEIINTHFIDCQFNNTTFAQAELTDFKIEKSQS